MSHPHLLIWQWCGSSYNGGNCPSCGMVESGNGSVYNQDPYSYHDTTDLFHQLPHYETQQFYCCEYCGGPYYSSDCQSGNTLVYEQVPDNNYDFSTYDSQPHQFNCCEYCGGPHPSSDCQTRNPFPCNNYDYPYYDQPPQYQLNQAPPQPLPLPQNLLLDLLDLVKDLKEIKHAQDNPKSMEELLAEEQAAKINSQIAIEKSIRESIEEEKAARSSSRFRFIPDDSDDEDTLDIPQFYKDSSSSSVEIPSVEFPSQSTVITPEVPTHSLSMGDEHLDTVPEKESDEFIKSSVENLVSIPSESQGILDQVCDIPPPLIFPNDHVEMFSDSNDDDSLSCGDIVYVEELPSELVSLEEENDEETDTEIQDESLRATLLNVSLLISKIEAFKEKPISSPIPIKDSDIFSNHSIPEFEAFSFDHMGEKISSSTTSHSHNSLPVYDSFTFEEFSCELPHIISPPEYDNFHFDLDKDDLCVPEGNVLIHENLLDIKILSLLPIICLDQMSLNDEIRNPEIMNSLSDEDDELVLIVIKIFVPFFTYRVTSPVLHSFENEDTVFDPDISIYHSR